MVARFLEGFRGGGVECQGERMSVMLRDYELNSALGMVARNQNVFQ